MKIKLTPKSPIVSYTLVALAISLIVNFSYMLLLVVNHSAEIKGSKSPKDQGPVVVVEGVLGVSVDGFGYLVAHDTQDSIYVDRRSVRRLDLTSGDVLKIEARDQARYEGAHLIMSGNYLPDIILYHCLAVASGSDDFPTNWRKSYLDFTFYQSCSWCNNNISCLSTLSSNIPPYRRN